MHLDRILRVCAFVYASMPQGWNMSITDAKYSNGTTIAASLASAQNGVYVKKH